MVSVFGIILVRMRENADQNNTECGHFSRCEIHWNNNSLHRGGVPKCLSGVTPGNLNKLRYFENTIMKQKYSKTS